jgi:hypothetical protein
VQLDAARALEVVQGGRIGDVGGDEAGSFVLDDHIEALAVAALPILSFAAEKKEAGPKTLAEEAAFLGEKGGRPLTSGGHRTRCPRGGRHQGRAVPV